jgi:hypothetical protein
MACLIVIFEVLSEAPSISKNAPFTQVLSFIFLLSLLLYLPLLIFLLLLYFFLFLCGTWAHFRAMVSPFPGLRDIVEYL